MNQRQIICLCLNAGGYHLAQQVGQRDAPPGGGFEDLFLNQVRRLRFASVGGAPLAVR